MTRVAAVHAAIDIPEPDLAMKVTTESLLGEIALDLYRLAAGRKPVIPPAFTMIADHEIAIAVLRDEVRFAKEYRFLEMLAQGRFTANGPEWRQRAALTQTAYRRAPDTLTEPAIEDAYEDALRHKLERPDAGLFECFVAGAVRVMSACMGLAEPLPWPAEAVAQARAALKTPLCVSLCGHGAESSDSVRQTLTGFFRHIEHAWNERDDVCAVLRQFEIDGRGVDGFHPVGELLQNVMAATETTASALMWCVECLARFPQSQTVLSTTDGIDTFVDEVLRLFPPIPMVLRRCTETCDVAGLHVEKNDVVAISFVGLHCHPKHWAAPMAFHPGREEWMRPPASRPPYHPFSMGPRVCGGARLAIMEVRAGIRAFSRLFTINEFSLPLMIDYSLTSRPDSRIESLVRPRAGT